MIATCLPPLTRTHTEYRDAFALFDKRGDGKIDSDQIGDVLRALNLNPTETEVKKIVQEVDPNGETSNQVLPSLPNSLCEHSLAPGHVYMLSIVPYYWPPYNKLGQTINIESVRRPLHPLLQQPTQQQAETLVLIVVGRGYKFQISEIRCENKRGVL